MNEKYLSFFGDFLNYLIFLFIFISVVKTECFNVHQQLLSLVGLISTMTINIITTYLRR
ncbi:MAG: hypothetical protein KJ592_02665 [Nanoarchaeota archaeon]|nr:hypothetical protein [Nanoarchaeota archaeon]